MPQRTNEFQELVSLIQRALSRDGDKITQSAMVDTSDGSEDREIDILIESAVGPYRIRVAVEAKKESRKMDQVRFDAIVGKYFQEGGIRVNKVVVIAHKGFTKGVVRRAKLLDIDLVTLREAQTIDWSRLKPPEAYLRSAVAFEDLTFDADVMAHFGGAIPNDVTISCSCGKRYGSPMRFATAVFSQQTLRNHRELLTKADDEVMDQGTEKKVTVKINPEEPHQTFMELGTSRIQIREFQFTARLFMRSARDPQMGSQFAVGPHICKVSFDPEISVSDHRQILDSSRIFCSCCGREHGSVRQWAQGLISTRSGDINKLMMEALPKSPNGEVHALAKVPFPPRWRVKIDVDEWAPQFATIDVHAISAKGSLRHEQYEMCHSDGTKRTIDAFEGIVAGKKLRFVMPDGFRSEKIVLRIDNSDPTARKPSENTTGSKAVPTE